MDDHNNISVIIPWNGENDGQIESLISAMISQVLMPDELVLINTSKNVLNIENKIIEEASFEINILSSEGSFPGKARNTGFLESKNNVIAFLDINTKPNHDWLKDGLEKLNNGFDLYHGMTKFNSETYFQSLVKFSSYGEASYPTVPGSIGYRKFLKHHPFNEDIRSGEDILWKNKVLDNNSDIYFPKKITTEYNGFPKNIYNLVKKYFLYSLSSASIDIQKNLKDAYFGCFLVLSALIVPRWNYLISDWDQNPLYIDNVAKGYLLFIIFMLFLFFIFKKIGVFTSEFKFSDNVLRIIFLFSSFFIAYNWNRVFASWAEDALLYIPHVTKIYLSVLVLASILMRGLLLPIKRKVSIYSLLPLNWLFIGMIGICMDIAKLPGYLLGGARNLFNLR